MTSQTRQIDPTQATLKHLQQKSRLSNWMGLLGGQFLKRTADEQHRTYQAQQRWVRSQWGNQEPSQVSDDMNDTYLGDVTHQYLPPQPQPQKSGIGPLLAAALGMLGPAGAIGGYLLNQALSKQPAAPIIQRPSTEIRQIENTQQLGVRLLRESDLKPLDIDNSTP
jgi:hypothetical protein